MEKEIIWTDHAKNDLQDIYEFNIPLRGEEKSFLLIKQLVIKVDLLYEPIIGSTSYRSTLNPKIHYQKFVIGNHLIIFREESTKVYINRIFDSRQDPDKVGL